MSQFFYYHNYNSLPEELLLDSEELVPEKVCLAVIARLRSQR